MGTNGNITGYRIQLNGSLVSSFSKELIAEILHHEIVHAWLSVNYPALEYQLGQHSDMLNTFLEDLVAADIEIFTNYNILDAYANALFGLSALKDSDNQIVRNAFNEALQSKNLTWENVVETYKKYSTGDAQGTKKGTFCQ